MPYRKSMYADFGLLEIDKQNKSMRMFGFCRAGFSFKTPLHFLQNQVLRVVACDQRKRGSRQINVGSDHAFAVMLDPRRIARAVSVPSFRACFITCGRNDRQTFREVKGPVSPHQDLLFTKSFHSCHPISPSSTSFHGRSLLPRIHPSFPNTVTSWAHRTYFRWWCYLRSLEVSHT
jgi:hypothetical protein